MSFGFGILPLCLKKRFENNPKWQITLGVANTFSGGLFLAAGIIHILPEATEK